MALADAWRALAAAEEFLASGQIAPARERFEGLSHVAAGVDAASEEEHLSLGTRLATGLLRTGSVARALAEFARVVNLSPQRPEPHANLGSALAQAGRSAEACQHLERAVQLAGGGAGAFPRAEAAWVAALEATNQLARAAQVLDGLLQHEPDDRAARLMAAILHRRAGRLEDASRVLRGLLGADLDAPFEERVRCEFTRVLEGSGQHAAALRCAERARSLCAASPQARALDPGYFPDLIERVTNCARQAPANEIDARSASQHGSPDAPLFVVGFPRSGTTLVEHVLGALPGFVTSDEAPIVASLTRQLPQILGRPVAYPEGVDTLGREELRILRGHYLAMAERRFALGGARLVDKNPWNLIHVAFLRRIFPDTSFVFVLRDPRDACLSAFLQDFRPNAATIHMLTLSGAARLCSGMLEAWKLLRGRVRHHEVRYEKLVADFEHEARRLVEFVGVPWDPAVLTFHERAARRVVSTPSRAAVASPVSSRSVGRWRSVADQVLPSLGALQPHLESFGYE